MQERSPTVVLEDIEGRMNTLSNYLDLLYDYEVKICLPVSKRTSTALCKAKSAGRTYALYWGFYRITKNEKKFWSPKKFIPGNFPHRIRKHMSQKNLRCFDLVDDYLVSIAQTRNQLTKAKKAVLLSLRHDPSQKKIKLKFLKDLPRDEYIQSLHPQSVLEQASQIRSSSHAGSIPKEPLGLF